MEGEEDRGVNRVESEVTGKRGDLIFFKCGLREERFI